MNFAIDSYRAISQEYLFKNVSTEQVVPILQEAPKVRYRNSTLTSDDILAYKKQIEQYMIETKPYVDDDLTLTTLAEHFGLNPYHLSQVLNEGFGESFYKFINRYRVEESKKLLLNPAFSHCTLFGVLFSGCKLYDMAEPGNLVPPTVDDDFSLPALNLSSTRFNYKIQAPITIKSNTSPLYNSTKINLFL